jgi:hypothetical protein
MLILSMASASSSQEINVSTRGVVAQAYFASESADSCETTSVYLDAATNTPIERAPSEITFGGAPPSEFPPIASAAFSLFISKLDRCSGESRTFYASDVAPEFSLNANLSRAVLRADATMSEVSSNQSALPTFNVLVDLEWTAVADSIRVQDAEHYPLRDLMITSVNEGVRRPALAVGRISDGVQDFAPGSSDAAHTGFLNVHKLFIGCASLKCHPPPSS